MCKQKKPHVAKIGKKIFDQKIGRSSSGTKQFPQVKRQSDITPSRRMDVMVVESDHHDEVQETMARVMVNRISEPEIILVGDYKSESQAGNFSSVLSCASPKPWGPNLDWQI